MLKINEISETKRFLELETIWNELLNKSKDNNPFLSWEYLSTYWKHFGNGKKLRTFCIEDEQYNIIGIAPFRQFHYGFKGPFGYDAIEPLGYRGLMPEGADYTGLIFSERETDCLESLFKHLLTYTDWDFIQLVDLPETSTIPSLLKKMGKNIAKFEMIEGASCPYITLPNSVDVFKQTLGKNFRYNLRRYMTRLEKECGRIELKRYDQFGSVADSMNVLFKLHRERWMRKGQHGAFASSKVRDFYIEVATRFAKKDWLALYFLTVNDESVAVQYGFEYEQKMYFILPGFDPSYTKYRVGNLICLKVIEHNINRGLIEYDFLKGGETYKFDWTKENRRNLEIRFVNRRFASSLRDVGVKMLRKLKHER